MRVVHQVLPKLDESLILLRAVNHYRLTGERNLARLFELQLRNLEGRTPDNWSRVRSPKFCAFVRRNRCCGCGTYPVEAHHFRRSGMGTKCSDFETVPVCHRCHMCWHSSARRVPGKTTEETLLAFEAVNAQLREQWAGIHDPLVF